MGLIGQPGALLHRLAVLRKLNLASKIEGPMKALLGAMIAGIILLATKAVAGPGEDAAAVVDQWATTYSANDRDALVRLYATDALLFGTTEKTPVRGTERIRDYFVALSCRSEWACASGQGILSAPDARRPCIDGADATTLQTGKECEDAISILMQIKYRWWLSRTTTLRGYIY